jgi:acetyltransferase-like isoleucine patch superfamily enzyme
MFAFDGLILKVRRAETPTFKTAKNILRWMMKASLPVPHALKPVGRVLYTVRFLVPTIWRRLRCLLWCHPLFACRCESIGPGFELEALPYVKGHTLIYIGNNVRFSGSLTIRSGRFHDHPILRIGDRSFLGHGVTITCNREIVIEEDVLIAGDCKILDYDGHAANIDRRIKDLPPAMEDIRPVRVCRGAWIGVGSMIMKGVTIGEGAIVGAHSLVTHDVPAFSVAAGSPARVVKQNEIDPKDSVRPVDAASRDRHPFVNGGYMCSMPMSSASA